MNPITFLVLASTLIVGVAVVEHKLRQPELQVKETEFISIEMPKIENDTLKKP